MLAYASQKSNQPIRHRSSQAKSPSKTQSLHTLLDIFSFYSQIITSIWLILHLRDNPKPIMNTSQPKAPYKRNMTDKRRDQNRAAQRKYRAKRKQQVAHLEEQVSALREKTQEREQDEGGPHGNNTEEIRNNITPSGNIASNTGTASSTAILPESGSNETSQNSNMTVLMRLLAADSENDAESLMRFALREQFDVSKVIIAGLRALKAESERTSIQPFTQDGVDWRPELWPPAISQNIGTSIMPDPLLNGILLRRQAPLECFYHNCRQIGLAFEEMALPTCRSPWYSPMYAPGAELLQLDGVPPDLKPTPAQLTIAHHPFWDTIPFPWIRERIITLSARNPPPFQWHELKQDILLGGMVCWRSRAREEGLPWDRRSWEVRPWFRHKWGWLIEEQGKVEQQSKWWRAMQGQDH
ncbi:unnamed protein product [Periconia digitata]|uniref:BZIP domain-containing protein n=1 Tax=Periconia digitata TaxID=1303443 RepID=A0A9W4U891_9PLEO|nr:unnamed protein product [Periconia digitata]